MAKQRSSFAKLQRDKAKKERAAQKRAGRRERRAGETVDTAPAEETTNDDVVSMVSGDGEPSPQELLKLVEDLHNRREAGLISEDDFEEAKVELFARLQID
jgi:hypothetical protein